MSSLRDRTWTLAQILEALELRSAVRLSDELMVRRMPSGGWHVHTPHGGRKVAADRLSDALVLLDGLWPCNHCGRVLSPDQFGDTAYGKRTECRQCIAIRTSVWFQKHKRVPAVRERRRIYARQWRAQHRERANMQVRARKLKKKWLKVWRGVM